ncbi:MAG TPA: hypothetical protein VHD63_15010, partial [Ktedonobacteraceae bacterium]|nr:hypothetical protein [Ktedonobacteraceae bacterium]
MTGANAIKIAVNFDAQEKLLKHFLRTQKEKGCLARSISRFCRVADARTFYTGFKPEEKKSQIEMTLLSAHFRLHGIG